MTSSVGGLATESHSVDSLADWNRVVGATFRATSVLSPEQHFSGFLGRGFISDLQLIRVVAQPSLVQHRTVEGPPDATGTLLVHLQSRGSSLNTQGRRCSRLQAGEAVLCDANREYSVEFESLYEMYVLKFPLAQLARRQSAIEAGDVSATRLDAPCSQLLLAFLGAAWAQLGSLGHDPDWQECVGNTVYDLIVRSVARSDGLQACGPLRAAILEYTRRHLADPGLRVAAIAQSVGVSSRTVQSVFGRMATTASAYILAERLQLAAARLKSGRDTITQIALDSGFNDPAYFTRCFRRHYGMPPRSYAGHRRPQGSRRPG